MPRRFIALGLAAIATAGTMISGCAMFQAAKRPPEDLTIQRTPERVARGSYLVNHVMACFGCHSQVDANTHAPLPGMAGAGGRGFTRDEGLPGNIFSTNLTPDPETGLGSWTDGEILRAMREGVSKDGHALFPLMPYPNYRQMSDEDAQAIVAYLRTLKPVRNPVPARQLDFPVSLIVNVIPKQVEGPVAPPPSAQADKVGHGRYVATMASCVECHTPQTPQGPDKSKLFAGGYPFPVDGKTYWMPNLTSDKETGLGNWTDAQIEGAVRYGQCPQGGQLSAVMPWPIYNGMSQEDMASLIAFLRTVPPIKSPPAPGAKP
jgi:mono/diheme cytochrome c family protein